MCTIVFQINPDKETLQTGLTNINKRSRDGFGAVLNGNKYIKIESYSDFILNINKRNFQHILMHGRAIPESEPDYLEPNPELIQPYKLNKNAAFAWHGLINSIQDKEADGSDTLLLHEYLTKNMHHITNSNIKTINNLFVENIKGSYLIFVLLNSYHQQRLVVFINFLACFYNLQNKYVTSVPMSDEDVLMKPYSCYDFNFTYSPTKSQLWLKNKIIYSRGEL